MSAASRDDAVLVAAERLLATCRDKGLMLVTAESCTGGLVAAALTEIPGSSDVVYGGFVTYSDQAKTASIGVPAKLIKDHGAVSEEVARAMAAGALTFSSAQLAVAITGIAGPGGESTEKPVGLVHIATASQGYIRHQRMTYGELTRSEIRTSAVLTALSLLQEHAESLQAAP